MFNKKRIKKLGNEITDMQIENMAIRSLYESLESEIQKIKEKLEKFDRDIKNDRKALFDNEKRFKNELASIAEIILKLEERTVERFERLEDRVQKSEADIKGLTSAMEYGNKQEVKNADVLKEFIEVSGYEISRERNEDYMKAYKVTLTKHENNKSKR